MTNSKTTKRALLSSTLALLMCVAMLIGTTFAWFTDTASTSVNTIQSGTLKVDLVDADGNSLEGETLDFIKADSTTDILWEPGCTYKLPDVFVKNNGNLALKYTIKISGIKGDAKLNEAIVWTISNVGDGHLLAGETSAAISISGHMKEDAGNEYQDLKIEGIAITVYATQYTHESDSYGNQYDAEAPLASVWNGNVGTVPTPDAENKRHIYTADELAAVMAATTAGNSNSLYVGETLVLENDIDFNGMTIKGIGGHNDNVVFTFDGNGHTISNFVINGKDDAHKEPQTNGSIEYRYAGLFQQFNGTVMNLTVKNATVIGDQMVGIIASNVDNDGKIINCKVYDSTVIGARKVGAVAGYIAGAGCEISGCYAENVNVYATSNEANQSAEMIGYTGSGATINNQTPVNVNVYRGTTLVSTAAELKTAISSIAMNASGTVVLMNDINANKAWETVGVSQRSLTFDGNGHTIKNLNKPLFNLYGGTFKISNLTVEDSIVAANSGNLGAGVIVDMAQWANFYMDNCHVKNCELTGNNTRAAALLGYWVGGGEIKNSTVDNFTAVANGSVAGVVGHRAAQDDYVADAKITNCTVKNSNISAKDDGWRIGTAIGTVAGNNTVITNFTESANTLEQFRTNSTAETNPNHSVYGRISGGTLTIDGISQ